MRALLPALLVALVLTSCGDEDKTDTTPTTVSQSTALPLVVERSGGVGGIHDRLLVRADGTGTVSHNQGQEVALTKAQTTAVRSALRELDFRGLDERYGPPEGTVVADGIDYVFTAGGETIVLQDLAEDVPEPLAQLQAAAAAEMNE